MISNDEMQVAFSKVLALLQEMECAENYEVFLRYYNLVSEIFQDLLEKAIDKSKNL